MVSRIRLLMLGLLAAMLAREASAVVDSPTAPTKLFERLLRLMAAPPPEQNGRVRLVQGRAFCLQPRSGSIE
jgi:hypothetical protein